MSSEVTHSLTITNNNDRLSVPVGSIIRIMLSENPATGFQWLENAINEAHLRIVKRTFIPPEENKNFGAHGMIEIVVEAVSPAKESRFVLEYKRPFEPSSDEHQFFSLIFKILAKE